MADRSVVFDIIANDRASDAFGKAGKSADTFGGKLESAGKTMTRTLTPAAAGLAVAFGKAFSDFDTGADSIRVSTGKTGKALDAMTDSMKKVAGEVTQPLAKVGEAIGQVSQKLGLTGEPLEQMTKKFLDLSRITGADVSTSIESVTGLFNNFGIAAKDQSAKLDELFRASQATGIGVDELASKMSDGGVQLRSLGFSFEEAATLVSGLAKAGSDASDVMPALSKVMAVAAKSGKDASTVFGDLFASIKNAPDDTKAAGIAVDSLGAKAGPKLAALIREGKLSLDELQNTITNGKDTVEGAAKDAQDWGDDLAMLRNRVVAVIGPFGEMGMAAAGVAASLGPAITGMGKFSDLVSKAGGVGGLVSKLSSAVTSVPFLAFSAVAIPATLALNEWANTNARAKQLTDEFTAALRADNDVLGKNTTALILNRLEQNNQTDDLARAGVTMKDVTKAVEGDDKSRQALLATLKKEGELNNGLALTLIGLFQQHDVAIVKEKDRAAVTRDSTTATNAASDAARGYADSLGRIPAVVRTTIEQSYVSHGSPSAPRVIRRAHGGPVDAGTPYWVGDRYGMQNAELFVPDRAGRILTQEQVAAGAGAGSTHFHLALTARDAMSVKDEFRRMQLLVG